MGCPRGLWRYAVLFMLWHALAEEDDLVDTSDGSVCEDRDDRWASHGTNCSQMKRMCNDDGYSELVQAWCPVTCGLCVPSDVKAEVDGSHGLDAMGTNWSLMPEGKLLEVENGSSKPMQDDNVTQDFRAEAEFSKASAEPQFQDLNSSNGSNGSCPEENASNGTCSVAADSEGLSESQVLEPESSEALPPTNVSLANQSSPLGSVPSVGLIEGSLGTSQPPVKSTANFSFSEPLRGQRERTPPHISDKNISAGKALLLLEEMEEAEAAVKSGSQLGPLDLSKFKFQIEGSAQALGDAVLDLEDADADMRRGERLEVKAAAGATEVEQEDEESTCPEGWERVAGDVYGGDQWFDGWRHSAESMKDCALSCLRQAGCGSFEWSPSKKRCYRNSQTRPTHEQDRQDFVFCRRRPCPSFKTKEACVGPGINAGYYSKEVKMRPGSYCIWSNGHCQAPMVCTASDCFLPDGGLPGMELPSRYTLWISKAGLQASMGTLR